MEKIGRYQITGELGKGAMGVVYKATDPNIGRPVALKTMRMDVLGTDIEEMTRRFQNEARAAGVLNHPNIVTIYDAGQDGGVFYIAMEYIEGVTLAQLIAQKKVLPIDDVINITSQICAGLDYAHKRQVIHRDVKPANIMLTPDGTVKIMDFGIAKAAGAGLTASGEVMGTPNYMSPEQVKGRTLDGRSDLFSVAVMLYEMVTGEKPYMGQSVTTIIYKIVHETPIAPRDLDVTVPPGLSAVVFKALAKVPDERFQSGAELAQALRNYKAFAPEMTTKIASPGPANSNVPSIELSQALPITRERIAPPTPVAAPKPSAPPMVAPLSPPPPMAPAPTVPMSQRTSAPPVSSGSAAAQPALEGTAKAQTEPPSVISHEKSRSGLVLFGVLAVALALVAGVIRFIRHPKPQPVPTQTEQASVPATPTPVPPAPHSAVQPAATEESPAPADASANGTGKPHASKPNGTSSAVGELRILSSPPGAEIEIDGRTQSWYVTPFNTPPLKTGPHTIVAKMEGFQQVTQSVDVVGGRKTEIELAMQMAKATYAVNSTPAGAEIFIDGVDSGSRTPATVTVDPGQHRIGLRLQGYRPMSVVADAAAGQHLNIAPQLHSNTEAQTAQQPAAATTSTPQQGDGPNPLGKMRRFFGGNTIPDGMGAVMVRTRPKGVHILVNNYEVPRMSPFRVPLNPGSYRITLQLDGYESITRVVQVEVGKVVEVDEVLKPRP